MRYCIGIVAVLCCVVLVDFNNDLEKNNSIIVNKFALGSCIKQGVPAPIFEAINQAKPDVFAFLGDNIYGDTHDMEVLKKKYETLSARVGYQILQKNSEVIATWDDHDYGINNGGREYPEKLQSQRIFLDFFNEAKNSARRERKGIYTSYFYGPAEKKLQVILLDIRYHRTKLKKGKKKGKGGNYVPVSDPASTMLGEEQWEWLETELKKDAKIRFIASGTQILTEHNGYETWENFPKELKKLIDLVKKTKANGVIFMSGDTHWTEISKREIKGSYPLYDFTSSGLTQVWKFITPNKYRMKNMSFLGANFGMVEIDWNKKDPIITLKAIGIKGDVKFKHDIALSELQFK